MGSDDSAQSINVAKDRHGAFINEKPITYENFGCCQSVSFQTTYGADTYTQTNSDPDYAADTTTAGDPKTLRTLVTLPTAFESTLIKNINGARTDMYRELGVLGEISDTDPPHVDDLLLLVERYLAAYPLDADEQE